MSQKFDNFENQLLIFASIIKNFNEQNNISNLKKCYYKIVKDSFEFMENEWYNANEDIIFLKNSLMLGLNNISYLTNNLLSKIKYDSDNKNLVSSLIKNKEFLNKIEDVSYLDVLKKSEYNRINIFFGSNFNLLDELIVDYRKNLISSILGYCDSELEQGDLENYFSNKLLSSKIFKYRNQNQSEFIFPKLIEKNIYYFYDTFFKGDTFCIAGISSNINFDINNQYNCSDSFFINEEKNKLSSVLNFKEIDNNSISKILDLYYSLKFTVNQDEFKDFSYSLNVCLTPYKLSKDYVVDKGTILTLFAEENSYKLGKVLPYLNINVYGEDTYNFYSAFKSLDYRSAAKLYLEETNSFIQEVFNYTKAGNLDNFNNKTLNLINNLILNYLQIFPVNYNEKITDEEKKSLINISSNLSKLHKEISNTQLYYKFSEEINKIGEYLISLNEKNLDLFIFDNNNHSYQDNISYEFYDQLYEVMKIENNQFISKEREKTILTPYLLEKASNFEIAECMDEFLNINLNLSTSENIPQKEKSKEFFFDTRNILSGKVKLDALTSQVNNLSNPSNSFKRWVNSVIIYDVDNSNVLTKSILSMQDLFNPKLLEDSNLIPYNNKCKNIFTNISDTMIYTSNFHFGEKLKLDLSKIYKQPRKRLK